METVERKIKQLEWQKNYCMNCENNLDKGTYFINCQAEYKVEKDVGIACIHYEEVIDGNS